MKRAILGGAFLGVLLLAGARDVLAAPGLVWVHGTSDESSQTNAYNDYWTGAAIGSYDIDGTQGCIVGYYGASNPAYAVGAWGAITDQIVGFVEATGRGQLLVMTHSNGSNPVRYMLAHPGAWSGNNYASTATQFFSGIAFFAGTNAGSPLAQDVINSGSMANISNAVVDMMGGGSYVCPAIYAQTPSAMATYNANGTFAGTPGQQYFGSIPVWFFSGQNVSTNPFSSTGTCGGLTNSIGLAATQLYGWGSSNACTDGMVGCNSSEYTGIPAMYGSYLNHEQSRRACGGMTSPLTNIFNDLGL